MYPHHLSPKQEETFFSTGVSPVAQTSISTDPRLNLLLLMSECESHYDSHSYTDTKYFTPSTRAVACVSRKTVDANANANTNALSMVMSKFCKTIKYRAKVTVRVSMGVCAHANDKDAVPN